MGDLKSADLKVCDSGKQSYRWCKARVRGQCGQCISENSQQVQCLRDIVGNPVWGTVSLLQMMIEEQTCPDKGTLDRIVEELHEVSAYIEFITIKNNVLKPSDKQTITEFSDDIMPDIFLRMTAIAEHRDIRQKGHVLRVGLYAAEVARVMGLSEKYADKIKRAAILHDIGKMGIPWSILGKPSTLTPEEFEIVKNHTAIGYSILMDHDDPLIEMSANIALSHHENWDGTVTPPGFRAAPYRLRALSSRYATATIL